MISMHQAILDRVLQELVRMPEIAAVGAYGSTATLQWTPESDLDLILIVNGAAPVNSLHFFVVGVSVDINLKSRTTWVDGERGWLPPDGLVALWDPEHLFPFTTDSQKSSTDAEHFRYAHRHRLLKLQRWMREDSDIADLMAAGATHWLAVSYFHARGMRFPGIDQAVFYWREHDSEMVDLLVNAAKETEHRLDRITRASDIALEPIGGLWRDDEVFMTGWNGSPTSDETTCAKELLAPVIGLSISEIPVKSPPDVV